MFLHWIGSGDSGSARGVRQAALIVTVGVETGCSTQRQALRSMTERPRASRGAVGVRMRRKLEAIDSLDNEGRLVHTLDVIVVLTGPLIRAVKPGHVDSKDGVDEHAYSECEIGPV